MLFSEKSEPGRFSLHRSRPAGPGSRPAGAGWSAAPTFGGYRGL